MKLQTDTLILCVYTDLYNFIYIIITICDIITCYFNELVLRILIISNYLCYFIITYIMMYFRKKNHFNIHLNAAYTYEMQKKTDITNKKNYNNFFSIFVNKCISYIYLKSITLQCLSPFTIVFLKSMFNPA